MRCGSRSHVKGIETGDIQHPLGFLGAVSPSSLEPGGQINLLWTLKEVCWRLSDGTETHQALHMNDYGAISSL